MIQSLRSLGLLLALAASGVAQQRVELQNGTVIDGRIGFEGTEVLVTVGEATLRVPLNEVEKISGAETLEATDAVRAERVLLRWLERRVLDGSPSAADPNPGKLLAALKSAPENPRLGYWSVVALLESGSAIRAREILGPRRDALAALYPGRIAQLERRVEARCQLESGPPEFVSRLDALLPRLRQHAATRSPNDTALWAIGFRLVDQDGAPVPRHAVSLSGYGGAQSLEAFADGYYLYVDESRPGSSRRQDNLTIADPRYAPLGLRLEGVGGVISWFGERVVQSRTEADRVAVTLRIRDEAGNPLEGVTWNATPRLRRGRPMASFNGRTDASGVSRVSLFPGNYSVTASLPGYLNAGKAIEVATSGNAEAAPVELRLEKALSGRVRVEWRLVNLATKETGPKRKDKYTLDGKSRTAPPGAPPGLNIMQRGKQVLLVTHPNVYQHPALVALSWNRVLDKPFEECDLSRLGELRDEGQTIPDGQSFANSNQPNRGYSNGFAAAFRIEPGKTYVGETPSGGQQRLGGGELIQYKFVLEIDSNE